MMKRGGDINLVISNTFKKKPLYKKIHIFYIVTKIVQVCDVNR